MCVVWEVLVNVQTLGVARRKSADWIKILETLETLTFDLRY